MRHIRAANQLTEAVHVTDRFRSEGIQAAIRFVHETLPERLKDPQFREELIGPDPDRRTHPELLLGDMFEQIGSYIKYGMVDPNQFLDIAGSLIENTWEASKDAIALRRFGRNSSTLYENFEYLAVLARDFARKHPEGNYPRGVRRLMTEADWKNLS